MRKFKRWLRRCRGEWLIRRRRKEIAEEIRSFFDLAQPPVLRPAGNRGNDSIYFVYLDDTILGVLRLLNPWRDRTDVAAGQPAIPEKAELRIAREWNAYRVGGEAGLTPEALWRTNDALLCSYLPWLSLQERLETGPEQVWDLLCGAAKKIKALHETGLVHMDVSLANMLGDETMHQIRFVDFEYGPAPGLPTGAQKLYDYLRLVESSWKFIPSSLREGSREWIETFVSCADEETRRPEHLKLLAPALQRILADPAFSGQLQEALSASLKEPALTTNSL